MHEVLVEMAAAGCFEDTPSLNEFRSRVFPEGGAPERTVRDFYEDFLEAHMSIDAYVDAIRGE